jgi:multidrug efflux pump subunit AcrA (membrane-fusion protein)/YHS domain-containing protein
MHPSYKSDKPGIAPDCGMPLEAVYAESSTPPASVPGTVRVDAERQRLIGVRVAEARESSPQETLRVLGRVAADEARLYKLNAGSDGLVRDTGSATTGSLVKKDEVLAGYFTNESVTFRNQQGYLNLLNPSADTGFTEFARDTLKLAGLSEAQIQELARTRKLTSTYRITSPVDGIVLARNVSPGQRFDKGFEFYRIADLSSVWVVANVFENDARWLRSVSGTTVRYLGRTFPSRRSSVAPEFDANTRALKVRIEVANAGYELRPEMFVDVEFKVHMPPAIVVPATAVLDAGLRQAVFVEREAGVFEPRAVETGGRLGDGVVIASGLTPGERIAVAGNFLIDSESRFQLSAAAPASPGKTRDPVCGMEIAPDRARHKTEFQGVTYLFCSEDCMRKFAANPRRPS